MKSSELKKMSVDELKKELVEVQREMFNFRMQKATSQLTKTHLVRAAKKNVARIKTLLKEKAITGVKDER